MGGAGRVNPASHRGRYGAVMSRKLVAGIVIAAAVGAAASIHRVIKPVPS
jgi:hypothetical protein